MVAVEVERLVAAGRARKVGVTGRRTASQGTALASCSQRRKSTAGMLVMSGAVAPADSRSLNSNVSIRGGTWANAEYDTTEAAGTELGRVQCTMRMRALRVIARFRVSTRRCRCRSRSRPAGRTLPSDCRQPAASAASSHARVAAFFFAFPRIGDAEGRARRRTRPGECWRTGCRAR